MPLFDSSLHSPLKGQNQLTFAFHSLQMGFDAKFGGFSQPHKSSLGNFIAYLYVLITAVTTQFVYF